MKKKVITEKSYPKVSKMTDKQLRISLLVPIEQAPVESLKTFLEQCRVEVLKREQKKKEK